MLDLKVYVNFGKLEIKRIQLGRQPEDLTMDELCLTLQRLFPIEIKATDPLLLKYQDDEGDLVSIYTDQDIQIALGFSKTLKLHVFRTAQNEVKEKNSELSFIQESLSEIKNSLVELKAKLGEGNTQKLKDLAFTTPQPIDIPTSSGEDQRSRTFSSTATSPIPQHQPPQYGTSISQPLPLSPTATQRHYHSQSQVIQNQVQMQHKPASMPFPQQHLYAKPIQPQPAGQEYFPSTYPQQYQQAPPQQYSSMPTQSPLPPPKSFR